METDAQRRETAVRLEAENIGGIQETAVEFESGVTILTGRNATNRTSLLQAIMAGLGSDRASLKGDSERGRVHLQIGEKEYTRTLTRENGSVSFGGDPYLDNPELPDLFAFLLESNEARRTVALSGDLREIIMKPVDAASIRTEIRQLQSEKQAVESDIEERESLRGQLPTLEERRVDLGERIEKTREELEEKRAEIEDLSTDAAEAREERSRLEEKMQAIQEKQSDLETTEFRLDNQRQSLESLRAELADLQAEREGFAEEAEGDLAHIRSEISRLREKKQRLDTELSKLQSVIQFNEEMLEGTNQDIAAALRDEDDDTVTDRLLDGAETTVCWTCGTEIETERIEATLDSLRELRQSKYSEQNEIDDELSDLKDRRSTLESRQEKRRTVERRLENIEEEIAERETKIDDLEARREELVGEIETLEAELDEMETQDNSEVLDAHKELNQLELEVERLEEERDGVEEEIEELEAQIDGIDDLEARRDQLAEQVTELRTRIDRIEEQAVEEFNDHMDTVLDILEYANLDRIWVERVEQQTHRRGNETETEFRLHVIRSTDDGVTYEDDFEHLSESEREVTGLVFALAGYLAHEVYEEVPFILLDSLEAIDSDRIATLVEYIQEYAEYLVVALLPEDAEALDDSYARVTEI